MIMATGIWRRAIAAVAFALWVFPAMAEDNTFEAAIAAYELDQFESARRGFEQLAERGHAGAETMLGVMYFNGEGVEADAAFAAIWFYKASRKGDAHAQLALGSLHIRGVGVSQNLSKAYKWLALAEARSDGDVKAEARRLKQEIQGLMSEDQLRDARDEVKSWRPIVSADLN